MFVEAQLQRSLLPIRVTHFQAYHQVMNSIPKKMIQFLIGEPYYHIQPHQVNLQRNDLRCEDREV